MKVELLPDIIALERCQLDEIKTIAYTHISQAEFLSVELLFTNNNNGGTDVFQDVVSCWSRFSV
jgi:hypothetical protein